MLPFIWVTVHSILHERAEGIPWETWLRVFSSEHLQDWICHCIRSKPCPPPPSPLKPTTNYYCAVNNGTAVPIAYTFHGQCGPTWTLTQGKKGIHKHPSLLISDLSRERLACILLLSAYLPRYWVRSRISVTFCFLSPGAHLGRLGKWGGRLRHQYI